MAVPEQSEAGEAETPDYLNTLMAEGHDALRPSPAQKIKRVRATKLILTRRNAFHRTSTVQGDDVLACAPPPSDKPAVIFLDFTFEDSATTETVEIHRHSIRVPPRPHAAAIWAWLSKSCLAVGSALGKVVPLLVLGLAALLPAPVDDLDDDDDEDEEGVELTVAP